MSALEPGLAPGAAFHGGQFGGVGFDDDVSGVAQPAAGQTDVDAGGVQTTVGDQVGGVHGDALGGVDGGGVPELDVSGDVVGGQGDLGGTVEVLDDQATVIAHLDDPVLLHG